MSGRPRNVTTFNALLEYNMRWHCGEVKGNDILGRIAPTYLDDRLNVSPDLAMVCELKHRGILVHSVVDGDFNAVEEVLSRSYVIGISAINVAARLVDLMTQEGMIGISIPLFVFSACPGRLSPMFGIHSRKSRDRTYLDIGQYMNIPMGLIESRELHRELTDGYAVFAIIDPEFARNGRHPDGLFTRLVKAYHAIAHTGVPRP